MVWIIAIVLSIIARILEVKYLGINFMQAAITASLFLWTKNLNVDISDQLSVSIKKLSTAIYLLHLPFLLVVDYNFKRGTLTGIFSALVFSITTYCILKRVLPGKQMKLLFG